MWSREAPARGDAVVAGERVLTVEPDARDRAVRLRIKICGLCTPSAAREARSAGADYVGVVVGAPGPRRQSLERAAEICAAAEGAMRVGVFADASFDAMVTAAARLNLDVLQLHGEEDPGLIARLREAGARAIWKAIRPRSAEAFERALERYAEHVDGVLVDGFATGSAGGAGVQFDWEAIVPLRSRIGSGTLFIVAGGLHADNVAAAIACLLPDVVDVSSGVESALCEKSPERMRAFVTHARAAALAHGSGGSAS